MTMKLATMAILLLLAQSVATKDDPDFVVYAPIVVHTDGRIEVRPNVCGRDKYGVWSLREGHTWQECTSLIFETMGRALKQSTDETQHCVDGVKNIQSFLSSIKKVKP